MDSNDVREKKMIHKLVFEMLDRAMRKIPAERVQKLIVHDDLTKDVYPVDTSVMRLFKKFELGQHFFYTDHRRNVETHFIKSRNADGKLVVSVIALKTPSFNEVNDHASAQSEVTDGEGANLS